MTDFQRTKLFAAEAAVWASAANRPLEEAQVLELADEFCAARAHSLIAVTFTAEPRLALRRATAELEVPGWARRELLLLHQLAHWSAHPVFPPHGAEFAASLLDALRAFASPALADELRAAFDTGRVHYDAAKRRERVRRAAVNAANQEPGVLAELIVDDPPELITGHIDALHDGVLTMGDREIELARGRYLNLIR